MMYAGKYGCDDGNTVENDGCSTLCEVNTGWTCVSGGTLDVCTEICGDGYDYQTYPCDDGNLVSGDGCDATCKVETGWTCSGASYPFPDICTYSGGTFCDTLAVDYGLTACKDANTANLDGCNSLCEVEKGWECTKGCLTSIDTCYEVCGDSWNMGKYGCDDGNVNWLALGTNVDGCSFAIPNNPVTNLASCIVDGGY
jgi:cysteine-rich repeat protein